MTRVDGDARGGAALSMRAVTGAPIKLLGVGEKLDALEDFHPDRIAGRILGMGDIVRLVEKAAETIDRDEAEKLARKDAEGPVRPRGLRLAAQADRQDGRAVGMLGMLPGHRQDEDADRGRQPRRHDAEAPGGDHRLDDAEGAPHARHHQGSRKKRIAAGSGTSVQEVNRLLKQFDDMSAMMKRMNKLGQKGLMRGGLAALLPGLRGGTGSRPAIPERTKRT